MNSLKQFPDHELVDLFKSGNQAAYIEIYDRFALTLFNHAYNKLRDREEAKDVVQEVFTSFWAGREAINCHANLSGYLYISLRNNILNRIARRSNLEKYVASFTQFTKNESCQLSTDHLVRERELSARIEKEISDLTPQMRHVFELSRKQYLSHKEIAKELRISEQTVSKHVTNALKILRVRLGIFIYTFLLLHFI